MYQASVPVFRHYLSRISDIVAVAGPDALDAQIADTFRREMTPVLGLSGEPVLTRVYRWPGATPQMEVGHGQRVAEIERRLLGLPGLFLTGAGIRGTGVPDCVADAMTTAEAVTPANSPSCW